MQETSDELSYRLVAGVEAKDEAAILKILEHEDEKVIRDIVDRVPAHHVRKLVLELRNILSQKLSVNHLRWLQAILILKFSVLSSMADGRSVLLPLMSLLDDQASPAYYLKLQALKGKISLLRELKQTRDRAEAPAECIVPSALGEEPGQDYDMSDETDSETESDDI